MKGILESSCYLLLMTIICYISLEFVMMNTRVSDIRSVQQYAAHFIEMYGRAESAGEILADSQDDNIHKLDGNTYKKLEEYVGNEDMRFECSYVNKTEDYVYYRVCISGNIGVRLFNLEKEYTAESLVRCPIYNIAEAAEDIVCA